MDEDKGQDQSQNLDQDQGQGLVLPLLFPLSLRSRLLVGACGQGRLKGLG